MGNVGALSRRLGPGRLTLGVAAIAVILAAASLVAAPSYAAGLPSAPEAPTPAPPDEFGRGTPQSTVRGFLEASALGNNSRAMNYLDLRRIPAASVATRGPVLAHQLRVVLDNTVFDLATLSDEPEGRLETGLPRGRQLMGRVATDKGTFSILLERAPRDDGADSRSTRMRGSAKAATRRSIHRR